MAAGAHIVEFFLARFTEPIEHVLSRSIYDKMTRLLKRADWCRIGVCDATNHFLCLLNDIGRGYESHSLSLTVEFCENLWPNRLTTPSLSKTLGALSEKFRIKRFAFGNLAK